MLKKILPHPLLTLSLWGIWLLLHNSLSMGHLVFGLIVAIVLPLLTYQFWSERVCIRKPIVLLKLVMVVLYDILISNLIVARMVLGKTEALQPSFLIVDLDIKSTLGASLLANTISLAPGTLTCDVNWEKRQLILHTLHTTDAAQAVADIKRRYEQPLIEVFTQC